MDSAQQKARGDTKGFTLIEMSIVLVIIGLIVGGVLVGQNLIAAAAVRATVTQIEKYNTAANTFRGEYGYLPGDINAAAAAQFGFAPRGQNEGQGDGNGIIEGWNASGNTFNPGGTGGGETAMFWVDLSTAHLIDGTFNTATSTTTAAATPTTTPSIAAFLPDAKLGNGNYIYVYSASGVNYYGISVAQIIAGNASQTVPGLTVQQAYSIDQKIDDGLPQSGNVTAQFLNYYGSETAPIWVYGTTPPVYQGPSPGSGAISAQWYTCYDNGNNAANSTQYSVEISGGANVNCALSFRFQ